MLTSVDNVAIRMKVVKAVKQHLDHDFEYFGRNGISLESLV